MKRSFLVLLLFSSLKIYGQEKAMDSIQVRFEKATSVHEKIWILNDAASLMVNADLKKSFEYSQQARKLAIQSQDQLGLAYAILNTGKYYSRLGMRDKAFENYVQALELSERESDDFLKGLVFKVIGNHYYFNNDYKAAMENYRKALVINQKVKDEETVADLQNNIALILINSEQLDSALLYLNSAEIIYTKLHKPGKLANTLTNIGLVNNEMGRYRIAIEFYKKAIVIDQSKGLTLQEASALNNVGHSLIELGKYTEALEFIKKAKVIGEKENFKPLLVNVYKNLVDLNKRRSNFKQALEHHELLLALEDSLYNEVQNRQGIELRTKYESEQKERENLNLVRQAEMNQKQLVVVRSLLIFSAIFAVIVTILAIIYYRLLVQNRKAKNELTLLNQQIQEQHSSIQDQALQLSRANEEIAAMNENLQELVEEKTSKIFEQNEKLIQYTFHNSHRVRGPLTRILGLINLVKIGAIKENETGFLLSEIDNAANELDSVLKEINHSLSSSMVETVSEEKP
ncbi:MAG: tetratricopeptide repeat protein [Cyclobacteriaceae bacterium]|nr:tetratricopeptide repeat protein [Cyclobacteriaceae bacterium]